MEFKQEPNKLEKARNQKILQDSFLSSLSTAFAVYPNLSIHQHLEGVNAKLSKINSGVKDRNTNKFADDRLVGAVEKYLQELEIDPPQLWNQGDDEITEQDIIEFHDRNTRK